MTYIEKFLSLQIAGVSIEVLTICFAIIFATFFVRRRVLKRVIGAMQKIAEKTKAKWDEELVEAIKPPLSVGILVMGLWMALSILPLPKEPFNLDSFVQVTGKIAVLVLIAWTIFRSITSMENVLRDQAADPEHWMDSSFVPIIVLSFKTLVVVMVAVVMAQNLGYSVSGLVASLGIGGIAVALAVKDTLANFFGSLMVMIDKPFKIGDWIKGGDVEGVVEEIGFRSTRVRTFSKTIQVVPNDKLANTMIENMDSRKDKGINLRRVKMTIGLEYKTNADDMGNAVEAIREILRNEKNVDQKFFLVNFTDFGEFSLNIFVYYFTATAKWDEYLQIRQDVNLTIMRKLEDMGLSIAFPTQTIHLEKSSEEKEKKN